MADVQKNLPKRTGREPHKKRRQRSWARGQERKAARVKAQQEREAENRATVRAFVAERGPWLPDKRPSKQVRWIKRLQAGKHTRKEQAA